MALKAKPPEATEKRLKLFMFGEAKVGKTTAALQFPNNYVIDAERGTEEDQYVAAMKKAGSEVLRTTDADEVIQEIRSLASDSHRFTTLTIDPITPIYVDLIDKMERKLADPKSGKDGTEFGRHYAAANKVMSRLVNLVMGLDMNVIVTAHAKAEYGDEMKRIGTTFDGWKKLDYLFDLIIQIERRGTKRVAIVKGTRISSFPDGEIFDWSYAEFQRRYGSVLERKAGTIVYATPEQLAEVQQLIAAVNLPEDSVSKWLSKAQADRFDDVPTDKVAKFIEYAKGIVAKATGASA